MGSMNGQVAVVTGASRGIGLAVARRFHEQGARVVLCARRAEEVRAAAASLDPSGETAIGESVHAADDGAAATLLADVRAQWGTVDVPVNNAATNPHFGKTLEVDRSRWDKILEVNLWAPLQWARLAVEGGMGGKQPGAVIMMSSNLAATPGSPSGVYGKSKAALNYLTVQLAVELGPRVRVNAIAPGVVDTKFAGALIALGEEAYGRWPLPRFGQPVDIASAAEFLATDASSWMTGEVLTVDGGALHSGGDFMDKEIG